ncbi:hypothetical protein WJX72_002710 [[Myrmecia] bisecta]|uniref:Uncharacterized protein n=1 Tax=[Myrmecia] bisecta TaxID=41462 RepID=A0AAW1Q576_9CHLO
MGDQPILVDAGDLSELLERLQGKRQAVAKELARLPEAPKAAKDVFQLCRGFERAFSYTIESVDYSSLIRQSFVGANGLQGAIQKLPLDRNFRLPHVKEVCREADGYQAHLVSPEAGLRRLVDEALAQVVDPVCTTVRRIHQVLLDAAREASRRASVMADSVTFDETREALRLPGFEKAVMTAVTKALEEWREEAMEVVKALVAMEQSYVTAAFFRHKQLARFEEYHNEGTTALLHDGGVPADDDDDDDDSDDDTSDGSPGVQRKSLSQASVTSRAIAGGLAIPQGRNNNPDDPGDLKTGYLEKRIGEKSGRQSLPEAWKWQRRYFVLTEPKGMLYYFKSADDPPNYRGVINIKDCKVEDLDVDGMPKSSASKSRYDLDGGAGTVSLLIRVSNKDPNKSVVKNHNSIILRAETAAEKYSWLARLKFASEAAPSVASTPVRKYSSQEFLRPEKKEKTPERKEAPSTSTIASTQLMGEDSLGIGPGPLMYMGDGAKGFDAYLQQLSEDTHAYVRTVCNTLILTVPKAIVHVQIKRAQQHLLESLYAFITEMSSFETETLMDEESESMQRRAAGRKALEDIEDAVRTVKQVVETRNETDNPPAKVELSAEILALGGAKNLIPSPQRSNADRSAYGDYTPRALQAEENGHATYFTENGSRSRRRGDTSYAEAASPRSQARNPSFSEGKDSRRVSASLPADTSRDSIRSSGSATNSSSNAAAAASLGSRPPSARRVAAPPPKVNITAPASSPGAGNAASPAVPRRRPPPAPPA